MKTTPRHRAGFTLIELMAVITIIVILAGLVVAGMGFVNDRQARAKAKVQIDRLSLAIEEYKQDMGRYPGTDDNTSEAGTGITPQLYEELFYEGYAYSKQNPPPATWTKTIGSTVVQKSTKIYLPQLDPRNNKQGWVDSVTASDPPASITIKDPWGNEYRYRKGTNAQNPSFDLWSMGKDGKTNATDPSLTTPSKGNLNTDDVRNF